MLVLGLDMETRSLVDLKACGTDVYASDPSTDIICCSFIIKDSGLNWLWYAGQPIPKDLIKALENADEVEAHNARFDQLIYEYIAAPEYGFPLIKKEKWVCTAAQCRVNALPASLDAATRAANSKAKKDHTGSALIRKLSIPQKNGEFNRDPKLIKQMGAYCLSDSVAMLYLTGSLRPLSDEDKRDWQVNERINDRGVLVDIELAQLAQKYAESEKEELGKQLHFLTNGTISKVTQTKRLLEVLKIEFAEIPELSRCIKKTNDDGKIKYSLDKAARGQLLECKTLDPHYREVIELIDQGGNTSVSKFVSMQNRADPDTGRVHGAFIFAGAGQTQRFCVAGETLINVLSAEGVEKEIPITEVMPCDLVWDGIEYVTHEGVTFSGYQEVIEYDGVTATKAHKIITERGDTKTISDAHEAGDRIKTADKPCKKRVNLSRCASDCPECKE